MNEKEAKILTKVYIRGSGQLSPADLINGIAERDERSVNNLVVKGYLEEVPHDGYQRVTDGGSYTVTFYRITEKGLNYFAAWYQRVWFYFKSDVRTIIVAVITAALTTIVAILIERYI